MTLDRLCAQCGAAVSPHALSGLCPRCVGAMGFALWDEDESASKMLSTVQKQDADRMSFPENGGEFKTLRPRILTRLPELDVYWAIGLSFVLGFLSCLLWRAVF